MASHASMAPSDAPTLKMGNVSPSRGRSARIKARWDRLVSRRDARRLDNAAINAAMQAFQDADRPPPEPPPLLSHTILMTNHNDSDTYSVHTVCSEGSDDDSLFGVPPLAARCDYSSSDSSLDGSDYFTGSDGTSFASAGASLATDSPSVHSTYLIDSMGPPPPGSIMDYWDKPIPSSCLHNFPSRFEDLKCNFWKPMTTFQSHRSNMKTVTLTHTSTTTQYHHLAKSNILRKS